MTAQTSHLPDKDLEAATAHLGTARSMPAGFYTAPEIFDEERCRIFLKNWIFFGREDELPNPGDYRSLDTVGGPAFVIRIQTGELQAFANFCRHRGSLLLEGTGNCKRIICPYHAWSYQIDGRLIGCPDMQDAEGFDRVENGLVPIRLEIWAGFVFFTFDENTPPLLEHLGDMPERMASHQPEQMRCVWRIELQGACNWKLLLENAMETYHTGIVHRDSVGKQISRSIKTRGDWLCIQVLSDRSIATLQDEEPTFAPITGLDDDARQGTYFTVIHPTCQLVFAQDCLWWLNIIPKAHNASIIEIGGCFPQSVIDQPDFAAKAQPYFERWGKVGREDVAILEKQQRALTSVHYSPGPLSGRDDQVQALGIWVLRQL